VNDETKNMLSPSPMALKVVSHPGLLGNTAEKREKETYYFTLNYLKFSQKLN